MPLTDDEIHALDIIARYNFLDGCVEKGYITEEKRLEIIAAFGPKNIDMINYYLERMDEYVKDTSRYLDSLKEKIKPAKLPDTRVPHAK